MLAIPSNVKSVHQFSYYNSRHDAKDKPVTDIVGNDQIITEFEKLLGYVATMPDEETPDLIFQVSLAAKSTPADPKPIKFVNAKRWGANYSEGYEGIGWHTVHGNVELFSKLIQRGFITRLGIKHKGNSVKHFVGATGVQLDLDEDSSIDYIQTLDLLLSHQITPNIIHYSPSGNPENNKMRAIILFDSLVTDYDQLTRYIKAINNILPNAAKHVHDPGRLFYPTFLELPYAYLETLTNFDSSYKGLDESGLIPENETSLESSQDSNKTTFEFSQDSKLTANKQVVDYINRNILKGNKTIFDVIPEWCSHHGLTLEDWHQHSSPGENIEQWRGLDPINPEESTTGSSFTVYHAADGTYGYNSGRSGVSGDMPDLWFRLSNQHWKVNEGVTDKSAWWNAVREICDYHGVPDFTVLYERSQLHKIKSIDQCLDKDKLDKGKIVLLPHLCFDMFLTNHAESFYKINGENEFWLYCDKCHYWKMLNLNGFLEEVNSYIESFETVCGLPIKYFLTSSFKSGLRTCASNMNKEHGLNYFSADYDHVPCANGAFNVHTKELIPYSPYIRNRSKHKFSYRKSTGQGIKALRDFLELIVVDQECIDDVVMWIAATVQYQGYRTKKALSLSGDPGSGKSTLTDVITEMMQLELEAKSPVRPLNAGDLLNPNSRFATQVLEGMSLGIFDEFAGITKDRDPERLKNMIAVPNDKDAVGYLQPIERKGGSHGYIRVRSAFLSNSQEYPKLQNYNDGGWYRRFMTVRVRKHPKDVPHIFKKLSESVHDLFCWCLEQDCELIVEHFNKLARLKSTEDHWINRANKEVKAYNNKYWRFAEECLESAEDSRVQGSHLYKAYQDWCSEAREVPGTQTAFGSSLINVLVDMFRITDCKVKVDGRVYYKGVNIRADRQER